MWKPVGNRVQFNSTGHHCSLGGCPSGARCSPRHAPHAGRLPWTPPCSFTPPAGFGCLSFLCRMRMEARGAPVNENTETQPPLAWSPESGKTNRRTCQNALTTPSRAALRAKGKRTTRRQAGAGRELSDGAVRRSVRGAASESEAGAQAGPDVLRAEGRDWAAGAEAPGDACGAGRGTPAGPGRASQGASRGSPPSFPGREARAPHATALQFSFSEGASRGCNRFDFLGRAIRLPLLREDWGCAGSEKRNPSTCAFKETQVCSICTD